MAKTFNTQIPHFMPSSGSGQLQNNVLDQQQLKQNVYMNSSNNLLSLESQQLPKSNSFQSNH